MSVPPTSSFGLRPEFTGLNVTSLRDWSGAAPADGNVVTWDAALGKFVPGPGVDPNTTVSVASPALRQDRRVARFSGTTGLVLDGSVLELSDTGVISNLGAPLADNDATTKLYVDTLVSLGLSFGESVQAATTAALASLTGLQTVDGVALVAGNRVLVQDGTVALPGHISTANGIYVVSAGAWARATDAALGVTATGKTYAVDNGLVNNNTIFTCITKPAVFGNAIEFVRIANFSDIQTPSTSTDHAVVRWSGVDGDQQLDSSVIISDAGAVSGAVSLSMKGATSGTLTVQPAAVTNTHTLTLPDTVGASGTYLKATNGTGTLTWATAGDVTGPASSTANGISRFDATSGKLLKDSSVTISDAAAVAGVKSLSMTDSTTNTLTVQPAAATTTYALTMPPAVGSSGTYLKATDGAGTLAWATAGDVTGPAGATANGITRYSSVSGKIVKDSSVTISDAAAVAGVKSLSMTDATTNTLTVQPASATTSYTVTMPAAVGASGTYLKATDGAGTLSWATAGDVTGPASSTANAVTRYNATSGKLVKDSSVTISDAAAVAGVKSLSMTDATTNTLTVQPAAATTSYSLTMPAAVGATGTFLKATDGAGTLAWANAVTNSGVSTDKAIARFSGTGGQVVQNSSVTISDAADIAGAKTLALSGATSGVFTLAANATTTSYTAKMPAAQSTPGQYLRNDGSGNLSWSKKAYSTVLNGDYPGELIAGPVSSTATAVPRYTDTSGLSLDNTSILIDNSNGVSGATSLTMSGSTSGTLQIQPAATTTSHTLTMPAAQGASNSYLKNDGAGGLQWSAIAGGGDVVGPSVATANGITRYDGTTGKLVKDSSVTVSDAAAVAGVKSLSMTDATTNTLTIQPAAATTSHTLTMPSAQGAANTFLFNNGAGALAWGIAGLRGLQTFTTAGTSTYTPTAGTTRALVYVTGGGGAAGGAVSGVNNSVGSGGSSAGTAVGYFAINSTQTGTVVVGAGGIGVTGAAGNDGAASSFLFPSSGTPNATISGAGGQGGEVKPTGTTDDYCIVGTVVLANGTIPAINAVFLGGYTTSGNYGGCGFMLSPDVGCSGFGASSMYGGGALGQTQNQVNSRQNGRGASGYGSGGSGAIQTNNAGQTGIGGNGSGGIVVIYEY